MCLKTIGYDYCIILPHLMPLPGKLNIVTGSILPLVPKKIQVVFMNISIFSVLINKLDFHRTKCRLCPPICIHFHFLCNVVFSPTTLCQTNTVIHLKKLNYFQPGFFFSLSQKMFPIFFQRNLDPILDIFGKPLALEGPTLSNYMTNNIVIGDYSEH